MDGLGLGALGGGGVPALAPLEPAEASIAGDAEPPADPAAPLEPAAPPADSRPVAPAAAPSALRPSDPTAIAPPATKAPVETRSPPDRAGDGRAPLDEVRVALACGGEVRRERGVDLCLILLPYARDGLSLAHDCDVLGPERSNRALQLGLEEPDLLDLRGGGFGDGGDVPVTDRVVLLVLRWRAAEWARDRVPEDEELPGFFDGDEALDVIRVLGVEELESFLELGDLVMARGEVVVPVVDVFALLRGLGQLPFHRPQGDLRKQIEMHVTEMRTVERNVVFGVGGTWAWLATHTTPLRCHGIWTELGRLHEYIQRIESVFSAKDDPGGWEHFLGLGNTALFRSTGTLWVTLSLATVTVAVYQWTV